MGSKKSDRELAKELYVDHKGKIPLIEIAEQIGRPAGTVRGWKSKDKWDDFISGTFQEKERSKPERSSKKERPKDIENHRGHKTPYKKEIEKLEDADLTDKQRLFCIEYIKCFNATKAYQKAYEVDRNTAYSIAYRMMENDGIKAEIQRLKQAKLNRAMLDENDIFQKYIDIAFADITDFVNFGSMEVPLINEDTGEPILDKDGQEVTRSISYVDLKDDNEVDGSIMLEVSLGKDGAKVKLQDKIKALNWLSDRMDLLPTNVNEKLNIEKEKLAIDKAKAYAGEDEELENDGFIDALRGQMDEVWEDD